MALIDNLKAAGEQATAAARESLRETQLNQELVLAYNDLGGATFALIEHGALTDQRLASRAQRVRDLQAQLAALPYARRSDSPHQDAAIVG